MQQVFFRLHEEAVASQGDPGGRGRARPPPRASSRRRVVLAGFALPDYHLLMEDPEHLLHHRPPPPRPHPATSRLEKRSSPNDGFSLGL